MLPVFDQYIKFLKDKTNNDNKLAVLSEGCFWIDKQIIKAFDNKGNLHKILKINIDNDLNLSIKFYKYDTSINFETWDKTVIRLNNKLIKLENKSIQLLQKYKGNKIIDTNSTGKDSMVKTHLAQKAGLKFDTYFNVTTCDVADSNLMAKRNKYNFIIPDKKYGGFYQWSKKENIIPSRLNRCCCKYFKEDATIFNFDKNEKLIFIFGMRNDESNARANYVDEWKNDKWGGRDWLGILPIRQWTDLDIWLYIFKENIEINEKYKKGYGRVGCGIVCPNYTKSTWVLDQYWYPILFNRWRERLKQDFIQNNKWIIMNCTIDEYVKQAWTGGVFRSNQTEEVIEEFAEYNNLDTNIAKKYFQKTCINQCLNKRGNIATIKDKDTLAMNLKMFGRNIDKFMCKKCLLKYFNWTEEDFQKQIQEFKNSGCKLF